MTWLGALQWNIQLFFALAQFLLALFALVDAAIRRADAYPAAGKLQKHWWLLILGVAVLLTVGFPSPLGLSGLAATIASIVYLVDVRPAIQQVTRGGSGNGPYG